MTDVPVLDTIDFEALAAQARGLIPRFAPDWTDHNLHDPGITILDLFAWIVDQQVYRIDFISDAQIAAFAALMGVRPRKAVPARGLLVPAAGALTESRQIARGTKAVPAGQPDLVFAVADEIYLSPARPVAVRTFRRFGLPAGETRPADGPVEVAADAVAVELVFDRPIVPDGEGTRTVGLGLGLFSPLADIGQDPESFVPIRFAYRVDGEPWRRAGVRRVEGIGEPGGGVALLEIEAAPGAGSTLRLDFEGGGFPVPARPRRIVLNAVPIVQLELQDETVIGEGNGLPDLVLPLPTAGLTEEVFDGRKLEIRTGDEPEQVWRQVASLARSGPDDRDYVIDSGLGTIAFGNGVNGRIPPLGAQIVRSKLAYTQGLRGILAANLAWTIGVPFGVNPAPIAGGRDSSSRGELLDELRMRARRRRAMLSNDDLIRAVEGLAGFGVERAEVIPRLLPTLPGRETRGTRTLVLHPASGVEASEAYLDAVERALRPARVLGERLSIVAAEAVPVSVSATILIAAGSDGGSVLRRVEAVLLARLSSYRLDPRIDPWPSGRDLNVYELEAWIAGVEGVVAVTGLLIGRSGGPLGETAIKIARTEVAVADADGIKLKLAARA